MRDRAGRRAHGADVRHGKSVNFFESGLDKRIWVCNNTPRNQMNIQGNLKDRHSRDWRRRRLWRIPCKTGAEGVRRKPNLSGKRTERVPDLCGCSGAVCSLELLVRSTGSFLLCKKSMQREKQHGNFTQNRADRQHVPVRLCAGHPAHWCGPVFHHPHEGRAGALLRRGLAALLRRVQSQR